MSFFTACLPRFGTCLECVQGPSFTAAPSYAHFRNEQSGVRLDVNHMGKDVVILKEGERICGTGAALGTVPIAQNKAYFQVNIQQTGAWGVGVATRLASLNAVPTGKGFWGIDEKGRLLSNGEEVGKVEKTIEEGDSVGVCYDHVELFFTVNGETVTPSITNVKGPVYPCIYVDDSAIIDAKFKSFSYTPPSGFGEILIEQTLL